VIAFSTVRNVRDNRPVMDTRPDWPAFADYLQGQSCQTGTDKTNTLCISPAIYEDGAVRAKRRVMGWNWFAADIDNKGENEPHATMAAVAEKMIGTPFVIYTTSSHTPGAHRFRLMFPLDRVVEPAEFAEFWGSIAGWLGCLDPATKDESRLFVAPRAWPGAEFFRCDEGEPLSVDLMKLAHPPQVQYKPRRRLTSAFADIGGLKPVCPSQVSLHGDFVTSESLMKASTAAQGSRMFPLLVRTGTRALLLGYAITADDLSTIGREFASRIGRDTSDIDHDAQNAHAAAISRYAEIKATRFEKLDPVKERMAKWKKHEKSNL
jgi:hypothetical protein